MEKLYSSKTALKEYDGRMHHSTQRYSFCLLFCDNLILAFVLSQCKQLFLPFVLRLALTEHEGKELSCHIDFIWIYFI